VAVPGEDAGDEPVGDALDQVPADLTAHQGARFVGLHGHHPAGRVAVPEALAHPHDRAAGAHPADHRVRDHPIRQLSQRLRAEPGAVLLNVPLRIELLRRVVSPLAAELGDLGQRVIDVKIADRHHLRAEGPRDRPPALPG
jgi:hypothetical protein